MKDYIHFRMLNIFSEPLKGPLTIQNFHEALKYIFNGIFGENKKEFKEERKLLRMSIR